MNEINIKKLVGDIGNEDIRKLINNYGGNVWSKIPGGDENIDDKNIDYKIHYMRRKLLKKIY